MIGKWTRFYGLWVVLFGLTSTIVAQDADRPRYRQLFVPLKDVAKLVPDNYELISKARLRSALREETLSLADSFATLSETVLIARIDGRTLRSLPGSQFSFLMRDDAPGQVQLEPFNLAVSPITDPVDEAQSRLLTDKAGSLLAIVNGMASIPFHWSLRGQQENEQQSFDLEIPSAGNTKVYLVLPASAEPLVSKGVLKELPLPWQGEPQIQVGDEESLYLLELAGAERLLLQIGERQQAPRKPKVVLREAYARHSLSDIRDQWQFDYEITVTDPVKSLSFTMPQGNAVEAVLVDDVLVEFEQSSSSVGTTIVLAEDAFDTSAGQNTYQLHIDGQGNLPVAGWFTLPDPKWETIETVAVGSPGALQVSSELPLKVVDFDLPPGWLKQASSLNDSEQNLRFSGINWRQPLRVQISREESDYTNAESALRLDLRPEALYGTWDSVVTFRRFAMAAGSDEEQSVSTFGPSKIQIQNGWEVSSIRIVSSDREIDPSEINNGELIIWPEPDELLDDQIHVRIQGQRKLLTEKNVIPPTYLGRWKSIRSSGFAMVSASSRLKYRDTVELQRRRLSSTQVPEQLTQRMSEVGPEQAYFSLVDSTSPRLEFDVPNSRFDVSIDVDVRPSGGAIRQQIIFQVRNTSGQLDSISLRFPIERESPIQWQIGKSLDELTPVQASYQKQSDGAALYQIRGPLIEISDGTYIVASRVLDAGDSRLDLPSVPSAFDQRGTLRLDRGVNAEVVSANVMRIPEPTSRDNKTQVLRFNPTLDAQVAVSTSVSQSAPAVIRSCNVSSVVDGTGFATIVLAMHAETQGPLLIRCAPDLQLIDSRIDGESVSESSGTEPASLELLLDAGQDVLIRFQTRLPSHSWGLQWDRPEIQISNPVLESKAELFLRPDVERLTWHSILNVGGGERISLPSEFIFDSSFGDRGRVATVLSTQPVLLVRNHVIHGLRLGLALFLVACGWWMCRLRITPAVGITLLVLFAVGLLWTFPIRVYAVPLVSVGFGVLLGVYLPPRVPPPTEESTRRRSHSFSLHEATVLFVIVLASSCPTHAQDVHTLFIPLESDGTQADEVYIPPALYSQITGPREGQNAERLLVSSALYEVNLSGTAFPFDESSVSIQAIWTLANVDAREEVHFPVVDETLRQAIKRIDLLVGGEWIPIRWPDPLAANPGITLPLNGRSPGIVRAFLSVPVSSRGESQGIQLPIPKLHRTELVVNFDANIANVELNSGRGQVTSAVSGRSLVADVGAADQIDLTWEQRLQAEPLQLQNISRQWYIQIQPDRVAKEAQLSFRQPDGRDFRYVELNIDATVMPLVTGSDWAIESLQYLEGQRALLRCVAIGDASRPIRLLWDQQEEATVSAVRLTDIRCANANADETEVLVAISVPSGWQIEDPFDSLASPAQEEQFLEAWNGRTSDLARVYRSEYIGPLPFRLRQSNVSEPKATELHTIHVSANRLDVDYKLLIKDYGLRQRPTRLLLPEEFEVDELVVQGQSEDYLLWKEGSQRYLTMGLMDSLPEDVEVYLKGHVDGTGNFKTPRIFPEELTVTKSEYLWSRAANLSVDRTGSQSDAIIEELFDVPMVEQLRSQRFALWRWNLKEPASGIAPSETIRVRTTAAGDSLFAQTVTTLTYRDRVWSASTFFDIRLPGKHVDYFTVEVPSRWFDEPQVDEGYDWISMNSVNRDSKILLIAPTRGNQQRYQFTVNGDPQSGVSRNVAVPQVRLLDRGRQRAFFAVPRRLTNETVAWKVASATETKIQNALARSARIPESHATYEAAADFSANLQPVPGLTAEPSIPFASMTLFGGPERLHLSSVYDYVPARQESLRVRAPADYVLLSARIDGVQVDRTLVEGDHQIQLRYNQLPQRVELIFEIPRDIESIANIEIPQAVDVSVSSLWFSGATHCRLEQGPDRQAWQSRSISEWNTARVQSVIECIDLASEAVQERTSFEMVNWLTPWLIDFKEHLKKIPLPLSERFSSQMEQLVEQVGVGELLPQQVEITDDAASSDLAWVVSSEGQPLSLSVQKLQPKQPKIPWEAISYFVAFFILAVLVHVALRRLGVEPMYVNIASWSALSCYGIFVAIPTWATSFVVVYLMVVGGIAAGRWGRLQTGALVR